MLETWSRAYPSLFTAMYMPTTVQYKGHYSVRTAAGDSCSNCCHHRARATIATTARSYSSSQSTHNTKPFLKNRGNSPTVGAEGYRVIKC